LRSIAEGTLTKDITATVQHTSSGLALYSQQLKASLDRGVNGKLL